MLSPRPDRRRRRTRGRGMSITLRRPTRVRVAPRLPWPWMKMATICKNRLWPRPGGIEKDLLFSPIAADTWGGATFLTGGERPPTGQGEDMENQQSRPLGTILWRRRWVIAAVTILAFAASLLVSFMTSPEVRGERADGQRAAVRRRRPVRDGDHPIRRRAARSRDRRRIADFPASRRTGEAAAGLAAVGRRAAQHGIGQAGDRLQHHHRQGRGARPHRSGRAGRRVRQADHPDQARGRQACGRERPQGPRSATRPHDGRGPRLDRGQEPPNARGAAQDTRGAADRRLLALAAGAGSDWRRRRPVLSATAPPASRSVSCSASSSPSATTASTGASRNRRTSSASSGCRRLPSFPTRGHKARRKRGTKETTA